ncbi:MAG: hypothetical protein Q7S86_01715 [bacterium]|nr:hypothetical protein [bacterium]
MNSNSSPGPDEKTMWIRKIIVTLSVGFLMLLVLLGVVPNITTAFGKGVAVVITILVSWLLWKMLVARVGGTHHAPAASGSGEGDHHGAGTGVVILAVVAVAGIGGFFMENLKKVQKENNQRVREEQVILMPPPAPEPRQHFVVEAPVGQEIRIPIPMGYTCDTDPVEYGTNHVVWVRREGEERFKDWKGRVMVGGTKKSWSNYKYLQSAGNVSVKVEVDIHPER